MSPPTFRISDKVYSASIERNRAREAKQAANAAQPSCHPLPRRPRRRAA
jgi:hypothetical protein